MKVLKKKFRKKEPAEKDKLNRPICKKIIMKKKLGRWCNCYEGRLPYPIECQNNKLHPITYIFKDGKKTLLCDRSICLSCERQVEFIPWKGGRWEKIKTAIANSEDLRDMDFIYKR